METVLVTGATGLIGLDTVRALTRHDVTVRAMVRRPSRAPLLNGLDVELVQGDLLRPESLRRAVHGVDTVLHLAARATMEPYERLRPTIVAGTRSLMDAANEAGVAHVVYASSLLVHGAASTDDPIDATTPPDPQIDYGRAKVEAEQIVTERFPDASILRLPHVYGPGDLVFTRLRRGFVVTPGLGHNPYAHLHVEDAARLLVETAVQRWAGAAATADDRPATWREFFSVIDAHHVGFRHLRVPGWMARIGAAVLDTIDVRDRPTVITPDAVVSWNLPQPVAAGLVWDDLGVRPDHPTVASGVPAALDSSLLFRWQHPVEDTS